MTDNLDDEKWIKFPEAYELLWLQVVRSGKQKPLVISGWWNGNKFEGPKLSSTMTVTFWRKHN